MESLNSDWIDLVNPADGHYAAVADVHGRADLFAPMLEQLDRDLPADGSLVLLGDLIDKGPQSIKAVDLAIAGIGRRQFNIAGNHESLLLHALTDPDPLTAEGALYLWQRNGGDLVLDELGVGTGQSVKAISDALGEERVNFLMAMLPWYRAGGVLFSHAGINPDLDLGHQMAAPVRDYQLMREYGEGSSMRWVRWQWVGYDEPLPDNLFVIYGHTPMNEGRPMLTVCQAGIDLGVLNSNVLCAAEVDHDRVRFKFVGPELDPRLAHVSSWSEMTGRPAILG